MRLDKYLKVARLIKRRTVAKSAVETDHVLANGRQVKPSYDVKVGDILTIRFGEHLLEVRVLQLAEHTLKADAASLYEIISKE